MRVSLVKAGWLIFTKNQVDEKSWGSLAMKSLMLVRRPSTRNKPSRDTRRGRSFENLGMIKGGVLNRMSLLTQPTTIAPKINRDKGLKMFRKSSLIGLKGLTKEWGVLR